MKIDRLFDELCNKVKFCTRCERMEESARVLSRAAGPLASMVMFIGEAPGRFGADTSEIPFHGDQAGHNFEELLAFAGLDRSGIFVTNAVLCNPKAASGTNAAPSKNEISNCSSYLSEQISLVDPKIVITLGAIALDALAKICPHSFSLVKHVRTIQKWNGRRLIPLYHPGTRAMLHRSKANQRADYQFVAEQIRRFAQTRRNSSGQTKQSVVEVVANVLSKQGALSYFGLHKIVYLIEWEAYRKLGHQLTGAFFLRQKDGPYCTDLNLGRLRRAMPSLVVSGQSDRPTLSLPQAGMFDDAAAEVSADTAGIVDEVLKSVRGLTDAELKTKVYLTGPMRRLLRQERTGMVNLFNAPISFDVQGKAEPHSIELRIHRS